MKILAEAFAKDGDGHVRLVPETSDDMWHVFNLLRAGDRVEATTFRKVSKGAGGASHAADHGLGGHGGSGADTVRVRVKLRLDVESVEYAGDGEAVRVRGRNTTDTPHVKLGAYHTLEIDANRAVVIEKTLWDAADAKRLRELADPAASADLAVLLITEASRTSPSSARASRASAKVEKTMPRKTAKRVRDDRALNVFKNVLRAARRTSTSTRSNASSSPARGSRGKRSRSSRRRRPTGRARRRVVGRRAEVHRAEGRRRGRGGRPGRRRRRRRVRRRVRAATDASSGSGTNRRSSRRRRRPRSGAVCARFWTRDGPVSSHRGYQSGAELRALDHFFETLAERPDRAVYGPAHVSRRTPSAPSRRCLPTGCFGTDDANRRRSWVGLAEEVEAQGGDVRVPPPRTPRGRSSRKHRRAATTRFPVPDIAEADLEPPEWLQVV